VNITTFVRGDQSTIRSEASRPSVSGICTSNHTTIGLQLRMIAGRRLRNHLNICASRLNKKIKTVRSRAFTATDNSGTDQRVYAAFFVAFSYRSNGGERSFAENLMAPPL
jgi:hypothetical protein